MTRSTARTRLVAASFGVLGVLAAALLAGCGAGQQAQTSRMQPAVPGTNANIDVPGGTVGLRDLSVVFPGDNGYPQGSTAPLQVRIFNGSGKPVTLTGVRAAPERTGNATPVDGNVVLIGSPSAAPTGAGPANASATTGSEARSSLSAGPTNPAGTGAAVPSPTGSPAATPSAGGSASPGATAVPPPTSTATAAGSSTINITIPAGGYVLLAPAYGTYLAVADLSREFRFGDVMNLEFRFGDVTSVVPVPLNTPVSRGPRTPLQTDVPE